MQTQRMNISLPKKLMKQFQSEIPQGKRSNYIATVLAEKLAKKRDIEEQLKKSLRANRKFYKNEYEDWKAIEVEGWPD